MADLMIDFEWPRHERYELQDGPLPHEILYGGQIPNLEPSHLSSSWAFIVGKGPTKIVRHNKRAMDTAVRELIELGNAVTECSAGNNEAAYVRDIGQLLKAHVPKIANKFGLLSRRAAEDLSTWVAVARIMSGMFVWNEKDKAEPRRVGNVFLIKEGGTVRLGLKPRDLADALMLHAAQSIVSGTGLQECVWCKKPFMSGGKRSRGKKREGTRFCCDQCRWNHNNALRAKARL